MCRYEYLDLYEREFKKPSTELREEENAHNVGKALAGKLFQGDIYVIQEQKKKWRI